MQTFIKKLSRNSEFAVVIPEDVKRQYDLEVNQVVSFEIARRDNGIVVLHKDAEITSVEGDTEIIFSANELSLRENASFENFEIYNYRVAVYSSVDDSEVSIVTQFFDKVQMITDNIFGMGNTDSVRNSQLVLNYNGALYTGPGYGMGTTQLKFYVNRNENFIVSDDYLNPYNVSNEGFDLAHFSYWDGASPWDLGFSLDDGSSTVVRYDESSDCYYIPSDYFQESSENSTSLIFNLVRGPVWKYGVKFRYFEPSSAADLGQLAMGQMVDFSNAEVTSEYPSVIDYFEGINLERVDGVETGRCRTFSEIIEEYSSSSYDNDNFPFFEPSFYESCEIDGFNVSGILRNGELLPFWGENGYFIKLSFDICSQLQYLNKSGMFRFDETSYTRILPNDILVLDVVLKEKLYTVSLALNFVNDEEGEHSSSSGYVDVYWTNKLLTDGSVGTDQEDLKLALPLLVDEIKIGNYTSYNMSAELLRFYRDCYITNEQGNHCIGFTIRSTDPHEITLSQVAEFIKDTDFHFFNFFDDSSSLESENVPLNNCYIVFNDKYLPYLLDGKLLLYPVFLKSNPFVLSLELNEPIMLRTSLAAPGALFVAREGLNQNSDILSYQFNSVLNDESIENYDESSSYDSSSGSPELFTTYAYSTQISDISVVEDQAFRGSRIPVTSDSYISFYGHGGLAGVCVNSENSKNIKKVNFGGVWGDWLYDATSLFSYLGELATFIVPPWSDIITDATATYSMTRVGGNIPSWNNVRVADDTYSHVKTVFGNIPPWGKVTSAISTYYGCSGLSGIWDDGAESIDIMPDGVAHNEGTVAGTNAGLRAYFTEDWGGVLDSGWKHNRLAFLLNVTTAPVMVNVEIQGYISSFLNFNDGGVNGEYSSPGKYYVEVDFSTPSGSYIDSPSGVISLTGGGYIELISNLVTRGSTRWNISSNIVSNLKRFYLNAPFYDTVFSGASSLLCVESLNSQCTAIGNGVFEGCPLLKTVYLPSCRSVGQRAFSNCGHLKKIVLGECGDFAADCFVGVGEDLEADENGIKTHIIINDTIANCRAHENFAWGAPSSVLFECVDGDLTCGPAGWNVILGSLERVSYPADNSYWIVADSVDEIKYRVEGLVIVAHYTDVDGNPIPEADEVLDELHGLKIDAITDLTEDFVWARFTYSGDSIAVKLPVSVSHVDISSITNRTLIEVKPRLVSNEFTAVLRREVEQGATGWYYDIINPKENVIFLVTYDVVYNGESRRVSVDMSKRRGEENHNGVYLIGRHEADLYSLGFNQFNPDYDVLVAHEEGEALNFSSIKNKYATAIQDGETKDVKYLLLEMDNVSERPVIYNVFVDDLLGVNSQYLCEDTIKVWMPFILRTISTIPSVGGWDNDGTPITVRTPFFIDFYNDAMDYPQLINGFRSEENMTRAIQAMFDKAYTLGFGLTLESEIRFDFDNYYFQQRKLLNSSLYEYELYYFQKAYKISDEDLKCRFNEWSGLVGLQLYKRFLEQVGRGEYLNGFKSSRAAFHDSTAPRVLFYMNAEFQYGNHRQALPIAMFMTACYSKNAVMNVPGEAPAYLTEFRGFEGNDTSFVSADKINIGADGYDPKLELYIPYVREYWTAFMSQCHLVKNEEYPDGAEICRAGGGTTDDIPKVPFMKTPFEPFFLYESTIEDLDIRTYDLILDELQKGQTIQNVNFYLGDIEFIGFDPLTKVFKAKHLDKDKYEYYTCDELKFFYDTWHLRPCENIPRGSGPNCVWSDTNIDVWVYGHPRYLNISFYMMYSLIENNYGHDGGRRVPTVIGVTPTIILPKGSPSPGPNWRLMHTSAITQKKCTPLSSIIQDPIYDVTGRTITALCDWKISDIPRYKLN